MLTVYKYQMPEPSRNGTVSRLTLEMPSHWGPMHVGVQGDHIMLWALVRADSGTKSVTFAVIGTGREVPEDQYFIGTVIDPDGYVWHVFTDENWRRS